MSQVIASPNATERETIRALAGRWAEIAALPIMDERKRGWRALHDLQPERPMVLFETDTVEDYVSPDELVCTDPILRVAEATMRENIRHFEEVGDDIVLEPWYRLGWELDDTGWGVDVIKIPVEGIGYTFNFPIKDPADAELLKPRTFRVNHERNRRKHDRLADTFGDLLPVRVGNYDHSTMDQGAESWAGNYFIGLTWQVYRFIGNDGLLNWLYQSPETIHALMQYMVDDRGRMFSYIEEQGLIVPNTDNQLAGPRAYGYVSDLPAPEASPGRLADLWCWAESQESTTISPAMYAEFVLPYIKQLTDRFGHVYYGCCEPVQDRLEQIMEAMPQLRSVSVPVSADFDAVGEMLGDRFVFSRKPDPVPISMPTPNWDSAEADLRRTYEVAKAHDSNVELLVRDVYNVEGDRSRLATWVTLARSVFGI